jgi:hypothetical protein
MWGDKYGEFHFADSSGISLQKTHVKFVYEPIFHNFESWRSELDWLLQNFHRCDWYNSLLCHTYYQFSFFFHHIPHSSWYLFWKCYTCPVDMKFCKHVLYLQRYFLNHFQCHRCLEKIGVRTISMNYVLVFEVRGKKFSQLWTLWS